MALLALATRAAGGERACRRLRWSSPRARCSAAVFLSVVASTTALVRHNLPAAAWPGGIAAFTIVFAAGQIVGPSLVGAVADGPRRAGARLRAVGAALLALGALLAARQRPLH